jgi:LuxR family maltose regulon positive regulatory protein
MKTRVWIKQDRMIEALEWVRERGITIDVEPNFMQEFEHITLARLLIDLHKTDRMDGALRDAVKLLERLQAAAEAGKRMRSVIEILVLQAIALETQGDNSQAMVSFERALSIAEPEGYLQIFVDEGQSIAGLLYKASSREIAPGHVRKLQALFTTHEQGQSTLVQTNDSDPQYIESLSKREIEVLELIALGLTNQEIAARLYLSLHTVKVHARNIYGKLGVKNRTQAVAKGKSMGILPRT